MPNEERLVRLEQTVRQHTEELEDHGGTLDHLVNTINTIILPTQERHTEKIEAHAVVVTDAREFIAFTRGGWNFVMKFGVVVAAISGLFTLGITIWRIYHPIAVH